MGRNERRRRRAGRHHVVEALAAISGLLGILLGFGTNLGTDLIANGSFLRRHANLMWILIIVVGGLVVVTLWLQQRLIRSPGGLTDRPDISNNFPLSPSLSVAGQFMLPSAAKSICKLPLRNPAFTGRAHLLEKLGSLVREGELSLFVLHGLGGAGKSSVALEFGHRSFQSGACRIVWWIRAETPVTMADDLGSLAAFLGIKFTAEGGAAEDLRVALAKERKWLLIFDNCQSLHDILPWLPHGSGQVLITSRESDWGGRAIQMKVDGFTSMEAVSYLNARVGRDETEDALALSRALGYLPLALAQAGAFVEARKGMSLNDYRGLFADHEEAGRLLAAKIPDYPHSVATTWLIHFDQLSSDQPAALELLQLLAFFDPDAINIAHLRSSVESSTGSPTRNLAKGSITSLAADLARSSLITIIDRDRVQIHRLVSEVTRRHIASPVVMWQRWLRLGEWRTKRWRARSLAIIVDSFPADPWRSRSWDLCSELSPHAVVILDSAPRGANSADLQMRLGTYLVCRKRFAEGEQLLQGAISTYRKVEPGGAALVLARLYLGIAQAGQGDHAAAIKTFHPLRGEFIRLYGSEQQENLTLLQSMITSYQATGRRREAEEVRDALRGHSGTAD
ncbi:hypothetical protein ACGFII_21080 [Micromonospora chalcea]